MIRMEYLLIDGSELTLYDHFWYLSLSRISLSRFLCSIKFIISGKALLTYLKVLRMTSSSLMSNSLFCFSNSLKTWSFL